VVIDSVAEMLNTDADQPVQDLLKACRTAGVFVVVDGETSDLAGSWPLFQAVRAPRCGIVLQPDQVDGEFLFKTAFPRMKRADFPLGRGMYVRQGRAFRVQVAHTA
jgi:S-DNA-T family DNA segregation ATPase FtsK/SpoIIIE